jgi:hypothetical protein
MTFECAWIYSDKIRTLWVFIAIDEIRFLPVDSLR